MPYIAIVDDKPDQRLLLEDDVREELDKYTPNFEKLDGWTLASFAPLPRAEDYPAWLVANDVWVLILDWRLAEYRATDYPVDYDADAVIRAIRAQRPNFPIFIVTNHRDEANEYARDVEGVFLRREFSNDITIHFHRLIRAANRHHELHQEALVEITDIAARIARGQEQGGDRDRLALLRHRVGLFVAPEPDVHIAVTLRRAEELKARIEMLLGDDD